MKIFVTFIIAAVCLALFATAKPIDSDDSSKVIKKDEKVDQLKEEDIKKSLENEKDADEQPKVAEDDGIKETTEISEITQQPEEDEEKKSNQKDDKSEQLSSEPRKDEETTQNIEEVEETTEIEKQQMPERSAKKNDIKPKKSLRSDSVYYVSSNVNGRFGKSVRTLDESQ